MSTPSLINVMLSSRVKTLIKTQNHHVRELSELRRDIKKELESSKLFGEELFRVWASEFDGEDISALENSWESCMQEVKKCHFFIFLFTGESGWSKRDADIGICHAELETALNYEPHKVFIIDLRNCLNNPIQKTKNNQKIQNYIDQVNVFTTKVNSYEEAIEKSKSIAVKSIKRYVDLGKQESSKGKFNSGIALIWSRMNFNQRREKIKNLLIEELTEISGQKISDKFDKCIKLNLNSSRKAQDFHIAFICDCVPDSMSVASARELVGQPFLNDYQYNDVMKSQNCYGPIHLIAVHKVITESQARTQLGFPDALLVNAPFGVYIADNIQKIQMIFLANCRDEASTRHNITRFLNWIEETGEQELIIERAISRRKIVEAINAEIKQGAI